MKLSILIPNYNFCCWELVHSLRQQCEDCPLLEDYEIRVTDDASTDEESKAKNREIGTWEHCCFIENSENMGCSRTSHDNVLQLKFPYIIIMDSDAEVCSSDFIKKYLENADKAQVLCGGIQTSSKYLRKDNNLRYKYEKAAGNIRTLDFRNAHPYQYFTTFNVFLHRDVFNLINLDESIKQYGYEDTLFGMGLKEQGISVLHIQNPLVHTGLDSNRHFLKKTELALQNLHNLQDKLLEGSTLLRAYRKIEKLHLASVLRLWHKLFGATEKHNLQGTNPSLFLFKIYKIGYFSALH